MSQFPAFSLKSFMQKQEASAKQREPAEKRSDLIADPELLRAYLPKSPHTSSRNAEPNFSANCLISSMSLALPSQNTGLTNTNHFASNFNYQVSSFGRKNETAHDWIRFDSQHATEKSPGFSESSKIKSVDPKNLNLVSCRGPTDEVSNLFSKSYTKSGFEDAVSLESRSPRNVTHPYPYQNASEENDRSMFRFCLPEQEIRGSSRAKNQTFIESVEDRNILQAKSFFTDSKKSNPEKTCGTSTFPENFSLFKITEILSEISQKTEEISALQLQNDEEFNWDEMLTRIQRLSDAQKPVAEALQKLHEDCLENPSQDPANEMFRRSVNVIDLSLAAPVNPENDESDSEPEVFWSKGSFSKPNIPKQRVLTGASPEFRSSGNINSPTSIPPPLFCVEETPLVRVSVDVVTIEDDSNARQLTPRNSLLPRVDVVTID